MNIVVTCPHCHAEITAPAEIEVICPRCQGALIASAPQARQAQRPKHWDGGPLLYAAALLIFIPLVLWGVWHLVPLLPEFSSELGGGVLTIIGLAVYFLPTMIAAHRGAANANYILLLNLFTGFTGIGWIAGFIWAAVDKPRVP